MVEQGPPPERDVQWVDIDNLEPDPMNPQKQDLATFNELVEAIAKNGMLETIVVIPQEGGKFRIVAGEHRWKAARMVGLKRVPIMEAPDWTEDEARMEMVRMNVLRGKLDQGKFFELWKQLEEKYGREAVSAGMGFASRESALRALTKETAKGIGGEVGKELAKRAERIRSVDDLHSVVQSLFARHGDTLKDAHFVTFAFGGSTHLMVRATGSTFSPIKKLSEICQEKGLPLDKVLADVIGDHGIAYAEGQDSARNEGGQDEAEHAEAVEAPA